MNENPDNGQETIPIPEGMTVQTMEMAMVSRAEYEKWTKDSADLEKLRLMAKSSFSNMDAIFKFLVEE
jgi:hypothetical protein